MVVRISSSPQETGALGQALGRLAYAGLVILVEGELGAGKTCFAQGVAGGLAVKERVKSPSFVIAHEYQGRLPMYHLDLYRLEEEDDLYDIGLSEYLEQAAVILIEWAERARSWYPPEHLWVNIAVTEPGVRRLTLSARGSRPERILAQLEEVVS